MTQQGLGTRGSHLRFLTTVKLMKVAGDCQLKAKRNNNITVTRDNTLNHLKHIGLKEENEHPRTFMRKKEREKKQEAHKIH